MAYRKAGTGTGAGRHPSGGRDGLSHLKINCVPLEGWNEDELCGLAALAREYPLDVRFIELMPLGAGTGWRRVPQSGWKNGWKNSTAPFWQRKRRRGRAGDRRSTAGLPAFRERSALSAP